MTLHPGALAFPSAASTLDTPTTDDGLYTYAIMRMDLEMPAGKFSSQASHASAQSLLEYLKRNPGEIDRFISEQHSGSRITLKAKNLAQLQRAHQEALAAGLPCALFTDSGHILLPHFTGAPVITGLGIGPATRARMRHITKRYQLA